MKITAHFCLLLPLLFLASCSSKPVVEPPADLIGEDTVVQMIAEQLIVEATIFEAPPQYNKRELSQALYSQLFEKHKVSVPRYRSSLTFYFSDKKRMEDIMTRAKAVIDQKKENLPTQ